MSGMFEIDEEELNEFLQSPEWQKLLDCYKSDHNKEKNEERDFLRNSLITQIYRLKKWAIYVLKSNISKELYQKWAIK